MSFIQPAQQIRTLAVVLRCVVASCALALAGCNPPPPSQMDKYLSEKCDVREIRPGGFGCKHVSWECPGGVKTETVEC